jgi:tetratricopeptide (TPR) repeat protein
MTPDYYEILGVEPTASRAEIEAALGRCQPRWSAGTRNPKTKHTYQSYLDQIPAIRQALLGDPTARAAHDAERAAAARAERDRAFVEMQRLIRLRGAKGGLTVSDRDRLRREAVRRGLTTEELDRLIEPIPPRAEAPHSPDDDPPDPPADLIDPATRRQIRLALEHLRKRDLYDVLGVPRDAPAREIAAEADEMRRTWMKKAQVTAEKTAWLEAVSYAQSHLGTPQARARYDRTLVSEAESAFLESVRFAVEGEPRLEAGTKSALLEEASALGLVPDRAERLLRRLCRSLGVATEAQGLPAAAALDRWLRCRSCGGVTRHDQVAHEVPPECRHCGASLRWECPSCKRERWVDEPRCACGFAIELHEPMVRHFEAAQQAHRARDFAAALAHLHRVQEFAPQHVGTRKAVERVKLRMAEIEQARAAFGLEFSRRHLVAALEVLRQWAQLADPAAADLRRAHAEVTRRLREARSRVARADQVQDSQPEEARKLYREALALAADLAEARDGLERCPPAPPTDLRAEVDGLLVRLRWAPPPPDGLGAPHYLVVRKAKGIPATPADGTLIGETEATEFADPDATAGSVLGYAVFTRRGSADSPVGAQLGPIMVLADVLGLRVDMRNGEVELNWRLPANALGARVVRKEGGYPAGPEDGTPVECLPEQALDSGLPNDRVYHYAVFALYKGPDGKPRPSRGAFVTAMPHRPVEPVPSLEFSVAPGDQLRLDWPAPRRGQVRVIRSPFPPNWRPGDQADPQPLLAAGAVWLPQTAPDHTFDPAPPPVGIAYYTPLTSWGDHWTAGPSRPFSRVPDPTDLRVVRVGGGGKVQLRWRWNPLCPQAIVLCKAGSPATGPDDQGAIKQVVSEADYLRKGYVALDLPRSQAGPWHIRIYGLTLIDGGLATSPGLDPTAHTQISGPLAEVTLSYSIRRPRLPGRPWTITYHTNPPDSPIPPTILVHNTRTVPLGVDDGEVIERFPASRDGVAFTVRPRKGLSSSNLRIFADPATPPDEQLPLRFRHPESERTRV